MSGIGPISETPRVNIFIGAVDPRITNLAVGGAINTAYLAKFSVDATVTVSKAGISVATQSGNMDLGIYDASGNRLASTGATAVGVAGYQEVALTAPVTLRPGFSYWAAIATDVGTSQFHEIATPPAATMTGLTATAASAAGGVLPPTISLATPIARLFGVRFVV